MKQYLIPKFSLKSCGYLLLISLLGALIAGVYGIAHDQVTYTLSPEYFTKFKFNQFYEMNPGKGDRWFVAVIGFLATWWIGMLCGWLMGRLTMPQGKGIPDVKLAVKGLSIIFATCVIFGVIGYIYGTITFQQAPESWSEWQKAFQIEHIAKFTRVGHIHNMGYEGGLVGSIIAGIFVRRRMRLSGAL